jgi:hypothetical protein
MKNHIPENYICPAHTVTDDTTQRSLVIVFNIGAESDIIILQPPVYLLPASCTSGYLQSDSSNVELQTPDQ